MTQSVNNEEIVKWNRLQGNVFMKALHPAMISVHGCLSTHKARLIGNSKFSSQYVTVLYNQEYVIAWLASKLIKPLQNLGLEGIIELVKEAWELLHKPRAFTSKQSVIEYGRDEQI
jgi:hypothetical protein